jgi:hypothetical protein
MPFSLMPKVCFGIGEKGILPSWSRVKIISVVRIFAAPMGVWAVFGFKVAAWFRRTWICAAVAVIAAAARGKKEG